MFIAVQNATYSLYQKNFPKGTVTLGGNYSGVGARKSMYSVILWPTHQPLNTTNPLLGSYPVPSPQAIAAGIPECTTHDPVSWHGLYDPDRNCRYTHTHNHNPHDIDDIFGPPGKNWGNQEISYPWQTFRGAGDGHPTSPGTGSGQMENELKHEGYKYIVQRFEDCDIDENFTKGRYDNYNCIKAWRAQVHVVGGAIDAVVRVHSYYAEYQICDLNGQNCGVIKHGGWADFGILEVPYKTFHVPLPADPPNAEEYFPGGPYRAHGTLEFAARVLTPTNFGRYAWSQFRYLWLPAARGGYNPYIRTIFESLDDVGGINIYDPTTDNFICFDAQLKCPFNHSTQLISQANAEVPPKFDTDNDGRVTGLFWTDRYGNLVENCSGSALDCVPLEFDNAPVGFASRANQIVKNTFTLYPDYDVSPAALGLGNEWWIEHPN
jgi:hypothetical protein